MDDLRIILNYIYSNFFKNTDSLNLIEIGTGFGKDSTKVLYNTLSQLTNFNMVSYEGSSPYKCAYNIWKDYNNIKIINEYFCKKDDIENLLIPNIPDYIEDYKITSEKLITSRRTILKETNFFTKIDMIPDIIFIDCSRFMHLPIINLCNELFKNHNVYYIMEEDYYYNNTYGELEIIKKFFNINIIKIYHFEKHQWPFILFNITT